MTNRRTSITHSPAHRHRFRNFAALLASGLLAAGCATNLNDAPVATSALPAASSSQIQVAVQQKPARIAMLLPLGGFDQSAMVAKSMKQAGELALFELDNPLVQLVVKDDKGTPEGAKAAAQEAISEGAEIILGPLYSKAVAGAAPVARAANVPVIGFSNDQQVAGNGVYLMSFLAQPEVERIVAFAASQGKRRFAALIPADAYGQLVEPAFREAVQRAGGTVVALEKYPVQANAMVEPVKRVVAAINLAEMSGQAVDAVFVPGGPESLPHLGPLLAYTGLDTKRVKLLGTGAWDYPSLGRDKVFLGGWYPSPDPRGFQDFAARFTKTFGSPPPRVASLAYDAVATAVSLSANPFGQRYTVANLTRPAGFAGIDGPVHLTLAGLAERGLAVLEVQPFGASVLQAAPSATPGPVVSAGQSSVAR